MTSTRLLMKGVGFSLTIVCLAGCESPSPQAQTLSVSEPRLVTTDTPPPVAAGRASAARQSRPTPASADARAELVERLRAYRRANWLGDVRRSPSLDRAAQKLADAMARTDEFSHRAGGKGPGARALAEGHVGGKIWENIGVCGGSQPGSLRGAVAQVWRGWEQSPPHRANLRMPVNDVGVGIAQSGRSGKWYFSMILVQTGRAARGS